GTSSSPGGGQVRGSGPGRAGGESCRGGGPRGRAQGRAGGVVPRGTVGRSRGGSRAGTGGRPPRAVPSDGGDVRGGAGAGALVGAQDDAEHGDALVLGVQRAAARGEALEEVGD